MSTSHPARRAASGSPARLDRRERHQLQKMEASTVLAHHEIVLRQQLTQSEMLAEAAVTATAMSCVAGSAGYAAVLRDAAPEAAEGLAFLYAKHTANLAQRMDDHSRGRR